MKSASLGRMHMNQHVFQPIVCPPCEFMTKRCDLSCLYTKRTHMTTISSIIHESTPLQPPRASSPWMDGHTRYPNPTQPNLATWWEPNHNKGHTETLWGQSWGANQAGPSPSLKRETSHHSHILYWRQTPMCVRCCYLQCKRLITCICFARHDHSVWFTPTDHAGRNIYMWPIAWNLLSCKEPLLRLVSS